MISGRCVNCDSRPTYNFELSNHALLSRLGRSTGSLFIFTNPLSTSALLFLSSMLILKAQERTFNLATKGFFMANISFEKKVVDKIRKYKATQLYDIFHDAIMENERGKLIRLDFEDRGAEAIWYRVHIFVSGMRTIVLLADAEEIAEHWRRYSRPPRIDTEKYLREKLFVEPLYDNLAKHGFIDNPKTTVCTWLMTLLGTETWIRAAFLISKSLFPYDGYLYSF